jgi:hypothetical protein
MIPLRNPHRPTLWGFFFARLPILFAAINPGGAMLSDGSSSRCGIRRLGAP